MIRAAHAIGGAGIDAIRFREGPMPQAGPGEALVRLHAATLNYRDLVAIEGRMPLAKRPDYIPLSCAAGEVIAVGDGVTRVSPGDRVSPLFAQGWLAGPPDPGRMLGGTADGVACSHGLFPADSLCLLPDSLGDLEAATLPCAGLTAWSALFGPRPLQAGEWVLAQGTGGVSLAALQWAKAAGAKVALTSSSDAKLRRGAALGADVTVSYRARPDWAAAVRQAVGAAGGAGIDIVVDVVGTSALPQSAALLNPGGLIASVGMLDGDFSWREAAAGGPRIAKIAIGNRDAFERTIAFAATHHVRPVIDIVYDLARLPDALRRLKSGRFFGKIGINLL